MFKKFDFGNLCWWCQTNEATTAEHKYKKSDIKKISNQNDDWIVQYNKDYIKEVQGPDSRLLKFGKNLCATCNGSRSQTMDYSWSKFFDFMVDNYDSVIDSKIIDFQIIFGSDWQTEKKNVMRYLLKHVCCRLHRNRIFIPSIYRDYLDGLEIFESISFKFCFDDKKSFHLAEDNRYFGMDPLMLNERDEKTISYIFSSYNFGPIKVLYVCSQGFHKGQHPEFEYYQNNPVVYVYPIIERQNQFSDMTDHYYFANELEKVKNL